MNRVFCTGDTHGQFKRICRFCYKNRTSLDLIKDKNSFNYIFSHTVPLKYERELEDLFLPSIDQSMVDKSTEKFLDKVEDKIMYDHWYFGHYHDSFDLTDKVTILFKDVVELNL